MGDLYSWLTERVEHATAAATTPEARRRCEADRRILARHRLSQGSDAWLRGVACEGCGTYGPTELDCTENLNDCPELLDLAHAYGVTDKQLAGFDDPPAPARPERRAARRRLTLTDILTEPGMPMSRLPATFRGPNWKP